MKLLHSGNVKKVITQYILLTTRTPQIAVMKKILDWIKFYKIHIISWIVYIILEIIIVGLASNSFGKPGNYVAHYTLNIALFYFCGLYFYPEAFNNGLNWIWKLPVGVFIIFSFYLFLSYLLDLQITRHTKWNDIDELLMNHQFIFRVLWRALQFMGLAGFYHLFEEYRKQEQDKKLVQTAFYEKSMANQSMENELNLAKNSYLQAQINPHLLFNTLNFIYEKTLVQAPDVSESVMTLADIMRYSTNSEFKESTVVLEKEIEHVENLIRLHMIRFNGERYFKFNYTKEAALVKFIPLVVITLAENIFKHGKLNDKSFPGELSLLLEKGVLMIKTTNLINRGKKMQSLNKGLANIEQRLFYAYGKSATIEYGEEGEFFNLKIRAALTI